MVDLVHLSIYNAIMIRVNIHEAKTRLSYYLRQVMAGETVVLCRRNVALAEIRRIEPDRTGPRPMGLAKGRFVVPPSFFEPLPEEILESFESTQP